MASISREANGRRVIQFTGGDGKRRSIRLGKVSQRAAETVKVHIERLVTASVTGYGVEDETARWVAGLDDVLRARVAAVGLVPKRESVTIGCFLDELIAGRSDVKATTRITYDNVRRNLVDCFGPGKGVRSFTEGDADAFRLWQTTNEKLADNTVRRRTGIARQFFKTAMRRGMILVNPFEGLSASVRENRRRFRFVTLEEVERILDACPDAEWRLLFALCRFGGLRCPSEVLRLTWVDVDWERSRITVSSPKTEHHPDEHARTIPLFPELLPRLREVFEAAEPGVTHVITRYRSGNQNLRTQFNRIVRRAGLEPWPKPFQNLRSSRETELAETWPIHVVCTWIRKLPGGGEQALPTNHGRALRPGRRSRPDQGGAKSGAAGARIGGNGDERARGETRKTPGKAIQFSDVRFRSNWRTGRYRTRTYDLTGVIRAL